MDKKTINWRTMRMFVRHRLKHHPTIKLNVGISGSIPALIGEETWRQHRVYPTDGGFVVQGVRQRRNGGLLFQLEPTKIMVFTSSSGKGLFDGVKYPIRLFEADYERLSRHFENAENEIAALVGMSWNDLLLMHRLKDGESDDAAPIETDSIEAIPQPCSSERDALWGSW